MTVREVLERVYDKNNNVHMDIAFAYEEAVDWGTAYHHDSTKGPYSEIKEKLKEKFNNAMDLLEEEIDEYTKTTIQYIGDKINAIYIELGDRGYAILPGKN